MSKPVYSTAISEEIVNSFSRFRRYLNKFGRCIQTNAAFCKFAEKCERDHKSPVAVGKRLIGGGFR